MEISFLNKNKPVNFQKSQDLATDPAKNISTEENDKHAIKNKVDTTEISGSHSGKFEDKKLMVAKAAILYDVSVNPSATSPERIEELKKAIDNNTYDVPANMLADTILKK
ncbi:MAG: flagellar biosynthesis anti-sigma factor FlgM [Anaerovoracaceae bacterium]